MTIELADRISIIREETIKRSFKEILAAAAREHHGHIARAAWCLPEHLRSLHGGTHIIH